MFKLVEIIVFVTLWFKFRILVFIIVNNSLSFMLFNVSVPRSSIINKSVSNTDLLISSKFAFCLFNL